MNPSRKSRKERRRDMKKMRRKKNRTKQAIARKHEEKLAEELLNRTSGYLTKLANERTLELMAEEVAELERNEQNRLWEEYDRKCVSTWNEMQQLVHQAEEAKQQERARIQKEFEAGQQRKEAMRQERLRAADEKRRQHELLVQKIDEYIRGMGPQPDDLKTPIDSNPDKELCSFFTKTASCRFGGKCTRNHRRPGISRLVLIQNLFDHVRLEQQTNPTYRSDMLEFDDNDLQKLFLEFFDDVLPELEKFGPITQFRVCRNQEAHLRGNVYVEFESERISINAKRTLDGRFYSGRQLNLEFCTIQSWKHAVCGLSLANKCPKGLECNYLHVFANPNNRFPLSSSANWVTPQVQSRTSSMRLASTRSEWDDDTDSLNGVNRSHWRWSESPEMDGNQSRAGRSLSKSHRNHERDTSRKRARSRSRRSRSPQQRQSRSSRILTHDSKRLIESHSRSPSRHRRTKSRRHDKHKSRRKSRSPTKSDSRSTKAKR